MLGLSERHQLQPFWQYAGELLLAAAQSGEAADVRDAAHQLARALLVENMLRRD